MEVGKRYYVQTHAYYQFCGEVVRVVGPRQVEMRNVVQVHTCSRNWTKFFAEGFKNDTTYFIWPDGTTLNVMNFAPWEHGIPIK